MDIIIINASDMSRENGGFDSIMNSSVEMIPLGLCYLATQIFSDGYEVKVVDMCTIE